MSINDPQAYLDSIWDWRFLKPCFLRGIEPTDLDGFVEIGGQFLVIEGKATGVPLQNGQRKAFDRMMRWNAVIPGLFTVMVIWGNAKLGRIDRVQFYPTAPFESNAESFRDYVRAWAEQAEERAAIQEEHVC